MIVGEEDNEEEEGGRVYLHVRDGVRRAPL